MDELIIYEFRPLFLTLDRIGPFRTIHSIDFTDKNYHPCNFYMMVSANGFGKTTALEIFAFMMALLGQQKITRYGHEDLDRKDGRAQLDFWTRLRWQGREQAVVFSVVAGALGEESFLKSWTTDDLTKYSAESWHRMGFRSPVIGRYENIASRSDELVQDFIAVIQASMGDTSDEYFLQPRFHLPTLLYFSAYRDIPSINEAHCGPGRGTENTQTRSISRPSHWGYQPLHAFDAHSRLWQDTLDNLLVWLTWLDNGSVETAQDFINKQVFADTPKCLKGVRRALLEGQIDAGDGEIHRLDRLSSGEKSLTQLFLRIGAHATANSIILIDEMDAHLHILWVHRLYNALEKLAKDYRGFTIIMTTHSLEIVRRFDKAADFEKEGLYLGGELIEKKDLTGR